LLGDNFLSENLAKFDRTKLTEEKMQIIEGIMQDPDFSLNSIYKSTVAAKNFYAWVKAIRDYHYIFKELEPRKNALINAEKIYEMAKEMSF
jgi:dynein heavy chain